MAPRKRSRTFIITMVCLLIVGGWVFNSAPAVGTDDFASIREGFIIYKAVLDNIIKHYVDRDKVEVKDMIKNSIDGMLEGFDPYTKYVPETDYENLTIQTKGQYGGLGISIWMLDKVLTVRSVFDGTPAANVGIIGGDRIIKIEGVSTRGITLDEAVSKLRGEPGSDVTITVDREMFEKPLDFTVTRDIIKVPSVAYAGIVRDGIGYVKVTRFAKTTAADVKTALNDMRKEGMKGVILDLRGNPGGLLQQAFEVGDLFLPKDAMIVYTKGRHASQNQEFKAVRPPVIGDMPLVVLVNRGSASASEIVSGAIQDLDRGLVVGKTTWGKGLVQTVLPVGKGNSALKITTAKYYTPSGRCIQRDEEEDEDEEDMSAPDPDDPESAEKLKKLISKDEPESASPEDTADTREKFKTAAGRTVFGGGGITPDIEVARDSVSKIELDLQRQNLYFKFAVHHTADGSFKPADYKDLKVDDKLYETFRTFVLQQEFEYKSPLAIQLERLEKLLEQERYNGHQADLEGLREVVRKERNEEFGRHAAAVRWRIKMELAGRIWGNEARVRASLERDRQIEEALGLMAHPKKFKKQLTAKK